MTTRQDLFLALCNSFETEMGSVPFGYSRAMARQHLDYARNAAKENSVAHAFDQLAIAVKHLDQAIYATGDYLSLVEE